MLSHDLIAHFFLVPNNIPLSGCTIIYPSSCLRITWLLPHFGNYEKSYYKYPCAGFFVCTSIFNFFVYIPRKAIAGLPGKMFSFVRTTKLFLKVAESSCIPISNR